MQLSGMKMARRSNEDHFKNGKKDGLLPLRWYENGQKKSEAHYKNDKKDGL